MKRIPIQFKSGPGEATLETKYGDARLEIKAEGEGGILHIKAYGLAFGNIDSWGDIIMPGAVDEFLKGDDADRMALCWQHDRRTVIGKITAKGVDDYGMWIEADILPTTAGNDAAILLKSGAVKEFSIGYRADKYHYENREGYEYEIRILDAITVYEVSPVTIAANRSAIIVSAKADPNHDNDKSTNQNPSNDKTINPMTPDEIKALSESIEQAASEKVAAEMRAKVDEIKALKEDAEAKQSQIDKLDQSIQDQQNTIKALQEKLTVKERLEFMGALKAAIDARKDEIEALLKSNSGSLKVAFDFDRAEVKTDYDITVAGDITRIAWGTALDARIAGSRNPANAFYEAFAKESVNALFFNWIEGSYTDQTAYVDELATLPDGNAAAEEKTRKMAKYGAHLLVSSEVTDFFTALYDWARGEAQAKMLAFADAEIFSGAGADTNDTTKKKIYGLKSQATAFSALATYNDATIADVIKDAKLQAKKFGYNLNAAFLNWADYGTLNGLKDANGRSIWDDKEEITIQGVRVLATSQVDSGKMFLADTSVVKIKERPTYELEIVRNAKLDGWDVYLRKSIQTLVKGPDKKGLIWVNSISTAISSITTPGSLAGIAAGVDKLSDAVNESNQIETHPNS